MKQLEIPFEFEKSENKTIFGGGGTCDGQNWITLDDANSLRRHVKHILVFNYKTKRLFLDGMNTKILSSDTINIKPSICAYLIFERCLRENGYRFNKKLSTIEKIPKVVG